MNSIRLLTLLITKSTKGEPLGINITVPERLEPVDQCCYPKSAKAKRKIKSPTDTSEII